MTDINAVQAAPTIDRCVVVLLDSLNRHMLGSYGGDEFATPNLDRFATTAARFTNNYAGSLPCIPARHDLMCGALDFLWKPWGSIEIWEEAITVALRAGGVTTKLVTDHPHLFESGGENFHTDFNAWDYQRGHESDPWRTRPDTTSIGAPVFHRAHPQYHDSRAWFRGEEDFPGPKTMAAAARWIEEEAPASDRWLLLIDEFDPHEPFDTPEPYASMYDPGWEGPHMIWPPYTTAAVGKGRIAAEQAHQIRAQYGGKLTMIDTWFGKLLDAIDRSDHADTTAVIVCTDHGHYLGEKDIFGKPGVPVYEPLGHTPLLIRWPGVAGGNTIDALTTAVDLHATIADAFGVTNEITHRTHGHSLVPLLDGTATSIREDALVGVWGREVHLLDGKHKYVRGPQGENAPISMWSNRWSTMPVHGMAQFRLPRPDDRAYLDHMPGSTIPVIRQPFAAGDPLPFWAMTRFSGNHVYNLSIDPSEDENRAGESIEKELADHLRTVLVEIDAPADQLVRLGLD